MVRIMSKRSLAERQTRAVGYWERTVGRARASVASVQGSRWRIAVSRALLSRRRPPFSGGSGDVNPLPVGTAVRQRVRALVERGILPGRFCEIRGGMRDALGNCTICGAGIGLGEVSLAVARHLGSVLFVHPACFDIWTREAVERGAG
jgi:hypothetical protein